MSPTESHALPFRQQGEIPCSEEEKPDWGGYIEWDKYPEKKKAAEILAKYDFPHVSYTLSPTELSQKFWAMAAHHWGNENLKTSTKSSEVLLRVLNGLPSC
jgi:hypothetical protein